MKGASKDEVVVGTDLVESTLVECPVVYKAARLVDDDECENSPEGCCYSVIRTEGIRIVRSGFNAHDDFRFIPSGGSVVPSGFTVK
jgi:hypothetical protein